jgi:hypothetical protein
MGLSFQSSTQSQSVTEALSALFEEQLVWHAAAAKPVVPPLGSRPLSSAQQLTTQHFPTHLFQGGSVHEWFTRTKAKNERYTPPLTLIAQLLDATFSSTGSSGTGLSGASQQKYILWIGEESWPTPYLLAHSSHLLSHSLFIKTPTEKLKLWAFDTGLHSPGIGAVVGYCKNLRFSLSQRFLLAAKANNSLAMIFRPFAEQRAPSAVSGRWLVEPAATQGDAPTWKVEILKSKGAMPEKTHWVLTGDWEHDRNTNHNDIVDTQKENPLRVLSAESFLAHKLQVAV